VAKIIGDNSASSRGVSPQEHPTVTLAVADALALAGEIAKLYQFVD
jgi:hypothetical protein